jgi:hypothetical protein
MSLGSVVEMVAEAVLLAQACFALKVKKVVAHLMA